jgi:hypothetical protein
MSQSGVKWLKPIILPILEVEIGKMVAQGQSRQKVLQTTSQEMAEHSGMSLSIQQLR